MGKILIHNIVSKHQNPKNKTTQKKKNIKEVQITEKEKTFKKFEKQNNTKTRHIKNQKHRTK